MTVQLLDDSRQELAPCMLAAVSERIVRLLNLARGGTVTARVRPQGETTAITILASPTDEKYAPTLVELTDRPPCCTPF